MADPVEVGEEVEVAEVSDSGVQEAPAEVVGEAPDAAFSDTFIESFTDEDLKGNKMWDNLKGKSADEIGHYMKELKSFTGKKGDIPGKDATDKDWSDFYSKLGRPESVEAYDFDLGDEFKEIVGADSLPYYEGIVSTIKEQAFAMGANPEQAEKAVDSLLALVAEQTEGINGELTKSTEANKAALDKEWGEGAESISNSIDALMKNNGMTQEQVEWARENGIFTEPAIAIPLARLAAKFADDEEIGHHQTQTQMGIKDQIADVQYKMKQHLQDDGQIPKELKDKLNSLWGKVK
jgi:hypothetical protein